MTAETRLTVWIDVDDHGRYAVCEGEEPRVQDVEKDPRWGTSALWIDFAPDFSWAETEVANQTVRLSATIDRQGMSWQAMAHALLALCEFVEKEG